MLFPVSHFVWQILRTAKRSRRPLTGSELRIIPNRISKDGTFLDKLVEEGLLEVVGSDPLPKGATKEERRRPVQFRKRYKLTKKGDHAAEYGEYDREVRRPPQDATKAIRAAQG